MLQYKMIDHDELKTNRNVKEVMSVCCRFGPMWASIIAAWIICGPYPTCYFFFHLFSFLKNKIHFIN